MERNSCGIALEIDKRAENGRVICGKPAVDFVEIDDGAGHVFRIWLCADHLDYREQMLQMLGNRAR